MMAVSQVSHASLTFPFLRSLCLRIVLFFFSFVVSVSGNFGLMFVLEREKSLKSAVESLFWLQNFDIWNSSLKYTPYLRCLTVIPVCVGWFSGGSFSVTKQVCELCLDEWPTRLFLNWTEIGTVLKLQRDRILWVHATYAVLVLEEFLELSQG